MTSVFLWKDVLYPDVQQRDRYGNWFSFSRKDTATAARNCLKMLRRGLRIPCVFEHQPDAEPTELSRGDRLANYVKHTFGEIRGAKLDGQGVLWLRHEVYDPKDAAFLARTRMQCSPKMYPGYSDSRGGEYRGPTVGHVAATPSPIQTWQKPFELSRSGALYLSYEVPPMADDTDDKGDAEPKGGEKGELGELMEALRAKGLTISDKVSTLKELIIAVESCGDMDGGDDDLPEPEPEAPPADDDLANTAPAPTGGAPMLMSMGSPDPAVRKQVAGWARDERSDLKKRVQAAFTSGRLDRPEARQWLRRVSAVEMSFTVEGEAVHPLAKKLAEVEARPAHSRWSPTGKRPGDARELSDTRAVDAPDRLKGKDESKEQKEATDWLCAHLPKK